MKKILKEILNQFAKIGAVRFLAGADIEIRADANKCLTIKRTNIQLDKNWIDRSTEPECCLEIEVLWIEYGCLDKFIFL